MAKLANVRTVEEKKSARSLQRDATLLRRSPQFRWVLPSKIGRQRPVAALGQGNARQRGQGRIGGGSVAGAGSAHTSTRTNNRCVPRRAMPTTMSAPMNQPTRPATTVARRGPGARALVGSLGLRHVVVGG